jgi:hypothetical protein
MCEYEKWRKAFWLSAVGTVLSLVSILAAHADWFEGWLLLIVLGAIYVGWAWWVILKE